MKRRLENTWFDETERPTRAAIYAALAMTNRQDVASLHYFSDTSSDKHLPPLAAAQLAFAFATLKDGDKANYWFAQSGVQKGNGDTEAALLPLLVNAGLMNGDDVQPALQNISTKLSGDDSTLSDATDFLNTMMTTQERDRDWRISINGTKKTQHGIMAITPSDKNTVLQNPDDRTIHIARLTFGSKNAKQATASISRHLYSVDGAALGDPTTLEKGANYLVVLEGNSPTDKTETQIIHEMPSPGLTPLGCAITGASDAMGWIKNVGLTTNTGCTKSRDALEIALPADQHGVWRIAYFARAEWAGSFTPTPATFFVNDRLAAKERTKGKLNIQ